ncbi:MAG: tetratricopeptide repeat protein [Bdellovibrionales bacterium]|nr:tetratricopeptide repeat protein [Bdellovibrionales bacterium]
MGKKFQRFSAFGAPCLALCLALALPGCAGKSARQNERVGEVYLSNGTQMLLEGDSTQAITALTMATRYLPRSHEAWNNLGLAFAAQKEWVRAQRAWEKALKLKPDFSDAQVNYGSLLFRKGRFNEAEKEFRKVLEDMAYSKMFQVRYNLGLVALKKKNLIAAESEFLSATRLNETFCPAWAQLAQIQKDKGELRQAEQSFQRSVKGTCFPDPAAHFEIASIHVKTGDMARAKSKFLEIIQFFPDSEFARLAEQNLALMN